MKRFPTLTNESRQTINFAKTKKKPVAGQNVN